jgi:hypothetical protein
MAHLSQQQSVTWNVAWISTKTEFVARKTHANLIRKTMPIVTAYASTLVAKMTQRRINMVHVILIDQAARTKIFAKQTRCARRAHAAVSTSAETHVPRMPKTQTRTATK